jgi:hypothetical protein
MKNQFSRNLVRAGGLGALLLLTAVLSAQTLDERIKSAVDGLAQRFIVEAAISPPVIDGSDTTSGLSRYLYQEIETYAVNHRGFKVVPAGRGLNARITGVYLQAGDKVRVNLRLISDQNTVIAASQFDIGLDELKQLNLAWLPENMKAQEEVQRREEILNSVPPASSASATPASSSRVPVQGLAIDVRPNSETRTYYDGEKLGVIVWADRDCFIKVYHIDVNNQMQLIFPNRLDSPGVQPVNRDNFLPADTELTVPRGAVDFVLHEPFGAETILVYASIAQFPDIEQEMFSPGTRAARETVEALTRGGSLAGNGPNISAAAIVSARFTFSILASSLEEDTFSYKKPADMAGALRSLRAELAGLGANLSGNEREGVFSGPGMEGSYRVNGGDLVLTLRRRGPQPSASRGARGYSFSFDRPRNLDAALNTVRTGIAAKGGSFTGNEREGRFQAGGIAGAYQVAERVNVSIIEKPLIIPNSLIEREVRNFFGAP